MGKRGPDPFQPSPVQRQQVATWVAAGIPLDTICQLVLKPDGRPLTRKTLSKRFKEEIESAGAQANAAIANSMFVKALAGDATLMIWWTKTRMGWRETIVNANLNLPNDSEAARSIAGRLVPELADAGKAQALGQAHPEGPDHAAIRVAGVLGTNGTARANGHA